LVDGFEFICLKSYRFQRNEYLRKTFLILKVETMKRYDKTQSKLNKILVGVIVAAFIYTTFGIEFSDLSWETNHETYKNLLL
jgi:hypothetical protein